VPPLRKTAPERYETTVGRESSAAGNGRPRVELRLAGAFAVILDGTELSEREIGSRKSRLLLKVLAASRPRLMATEQLADLLWDGQAPAGADRNIASLVSRLRAVLGAGVIRGGRPGYRLGDAPDVSVDLDAAAQLCEQAERSLARAPAVALAAAERAAGLLAAGPALADERYLTWADPVRDELRQLQRRARLAAAEAALATDEPALAARYAEAAMTDDSLDEAAYRWYMAATAAAGERARALRAYADLRQHLAEQLGTDPAPQTRELHVAILREESSVPGLTASRAANASGPGLGTPAQPGRLPRAEPVLVGRDSETAALRAAWQRAADREPSLVLIIGEAGIGKTALAEALAAEVIGSGGTLLRARCYETERSLFLQPVVEAVTPVVSRMTAVSLRELLGGHAPVAAALVPAVADALGPALPGRGSAQIARRRAFEAVTALVRGLADRDPVLLFIDDLHYAGQSTVELLHFLGRHVAGSRTLIVTTVRAEHVAEIGAALDPVAARLELGPLANGAVEQLASEAGQGSHAADILARTRGHTLFVVEVLRALRSGDAGLPESLRAAVTARVERAGPQVGSLLRAASVLGATVDPLIVGALLDLPSASAVDLCEQALRGRLFAVSGRDYEFANDLIREVIYATTPEPSRLAYHRRAADLLTGQPESLARHAAAAGELPRAARAWLLAAEDAMRRYAISDAIALATEALDAAGRAGDGELEARALVFRGRAHEAAGAQAEAYADLTDGARRSHETGDRRLEMLALRQLGGDVPVARGLPITFSSDNLESGLRIAESLGDRTSQADLLSRLAVIASNRLQLGAALDYGRRAAAAGRAAGDDEALAAGLDGLRTACWYAGDLAGLTEVLAELLPLLRRIGEPFLQPWAEFEAAFPAIAVANWDAAAAAMQTGIELNRRGGYPHFTAIYMAYLGWLERLRGNVGQAVAVGERAVEVSREYPHSWGKATAATMLGDTYLLAGDRTAAIEQLERGLTAAREGGVEAYLFRCTAGLGHATGSLPLLTEAAGLLGHAEIPADCAWLPGYDAYLSLARGWLRYDQPDRASAVLAPLLALAERGPWLPVLAEGLAVHGRALIQLGHREQAEGQLTRARRLASAHGMPHVVHEADLATAGTD
jgi:DNA-binding SARP family transcriptional activator/tetratricopeptide (TPR) repeat protein